MFKPEGDLTVFLEVLTAFLLLGGSKLSDVGGVADGLLPGDALQHGVLHRGPDLSNLMKNINLDKPCRAGQSGDNKDPYKVHTAVSSLRVSEAVSEVNTRGWTGDQDRSQRLIVSVVRRHLPAPAEGGRGEDHPQR